MAWFTPELNVTNGSYVIETENYAIDYVKGNHVTDLPVLMMPTPVEDGHILIRAKKAEGNYNANFAIYLNTLAESDSELIDEKVIHYAVCVGTCNSFTNIYTLNTSSKITIIDNQLLTTTYTDYNIYFWIDGTRNMDSLVNKSYSGYISAEASFINY